MTNGVRTKDPAWLPHWLITRCSLSPLVIAMAVAGASFSPQSVQAAIVAQMQGLVGPAALFC
jgi:hypothetical protein